ncbi:hypothetical protein [Embleya scabrispora]|uniref:hypothetical protein n=1 Tax=Embleya scabrispora TaxID=159449 RepID=UPI0003631E40|nr:hypothetical protein [Embleya scabrispora]
MPSAQALRQDVPHPGRFPEPDGDWTALTHQAAAALGDKATAAAPHLVVDEGQDLSPGFHGLVRLAASSVTVFADECRRLTETNSTLTEITGALGCSTQGVGITGHRSTREIASLAEQFPVGDPDPRCRSAAGPCPSSATA